MPIQLQNHRTSNAKLFSVSPSKQKLHTAASLQKEQKNRLKVSKTSSGNGIAIISRMFGNPTKATPKLTNELPQRNSRQRRHSLGGSATSTTSTSTTTESPSSTQRRSRSKSGLRRCAASMDTASMEIRSRNMDKSRKMDNSSRNSMDKSQMSDSTFRRKSPRRSLISRSRSFGVATVKPILPEQRRSMRRRGSNDSAATAPQAPVNASESLGYAVPQESPLEPLRAKREQFRRKSMGALPDLNDIPPSLLDTCCEDNYSPSSEESSSDDSSLFSGSS